MAGATPRQAVQNFIAPLREALGCVTTAAIVHRGQYDLGETYALVVNGGEPVRVARASDPGHVNLRIAQQYEIVEAQGNAGPYRVRTAAYMYSVEDNAGQEIFGYHWHPKGGSAVRRPHMHLEQGAAIGHPDLHRAHFPTGRVSVEDFLRLAVETFRLRTRRADWRATLNRTNALFRQWQTWG